MNNFFLTRQNYFAATTELLNYLGVFFFINATKRRIYLSSSEADKKLQPRQTFSGLNNKFVLKWKWVEKNPSNLKE